VEHQIRSTTFPHFPALSPHPLRGIYAIITRAVTQQGKERGELFKS
jgi:hypothetical protein